MGVAFESVDSTAEPGTTVSPHSPGELPLATGHYPVTPHGATPVKAPRSVPLRILGVPDRACALRTSAQTGVEGHPREPRHRELPGVRDCRAVRKRHCSAGDGPARDSIGDTCRSGADRPRTRRYSRLVARRQLPGGGPDLPAGQSAAPPRSGPRGREAATAGALGHHPRPQLRLRAPQPDHPEQRRQHDLHGRSGTRRPGRGGQRVPGRHLHRGVPAGHPRRGGDAAVVPAVLLPRRHSQPRRAGDTRLDPRGRRTRATCSRTPTAPRSTTPIWS